MAVVLFTALAGLVYNWQEARVKAAKKETKSVVQFHASKVEKETGKQGETVATQSKNEVGKETFRNLTKERIEHVEKKSGIDLGNVSSLTDAQISTVQEVKVPLKKEPNTKDSASPIHTFEAKTRFGKISGVIRGDSISIRDSITNPLMFMETRPRWKLRHLWPWNWGTRKRQVKLLIMNPDSRIDTLSNISIVQ